MPAKAGIHPAADANREVDPGLRRRDTGLQCTPQLTFGLTAQPVAAQRAAQLVVAEAEPGGGPAEMPPLRLQRPLDQRPLIGGERRGKRSGHHLFR